MTFNEARAALAIGCKVCLPDWSVTLYITAMDENILHYVNRGEIQRTAQTPSNHLTRTDWEIYNEQTVHSK